MGITLLAASKASNLSLTDFLYNCSVLSTVELLTAGCWNLANFAWNFAWLRTALSSTFSFFTASVITCSNRAIRPRATISSTAKLDPRWR